MSRILGPDEVKRFQSLQAYFDVEPTARRLDDFGRWIFSSVAAVATLGTGYALFAAQSLEPGAKIVYGLAMVFVGLSLACAVMILTPAFLQLSLYSPESLNRAFSNSIRSRRGWTVGAGVFLSAAFVTAGLVPGSSVLLTESATPVAPVTWTFAAPKLTAHIRLNHLEPGSAVTIELRNVTVDAQKSMQRQTIFRDDTIADDHGRYDREIVLEKIACDQIEVYYAATQSDRKSIANTESIHLAIL